MLGRPGYEARASVSETHTSRSLYDVFAWSQSKVACPGRLTEVSSWPCSQAPSHFWLHELSNLERG